MSRGDPSSWWGKCSWGVILLAMAVGLVVRPTAVRAQESGLRVVIFRPGEGETLYSNPAAPFAAIPIIGMVSANDFDLNQLQVRLEVIWRDQVAKSATLTTEKDGAFRIDVGINPNPVSDQAELEIGCDSRCHSMQNLVLPAGPIRLRVTVSDPLGHKAFAERSVILDNSEYANLPVQVMIESEPGRALAGVEVVANTRLYLWRARKFSALTDATGRATIHLERLSEAPTDYVLQIVPHVVDGTYVTSRGPVSVTLPAGATNLALVTVVARTQRGQINGSVPDLPGLGNLAGLQVRAVELSTGGGHTAQVSQGKFSLSDLPLDKYLLALDDSQAGAQNVLAEPQTVDLSASPVVTATLKLAALARVARGVVHDSNGNPLPFGWIATDNQAKVGRVGPLSGEFALGLADERVLWVTAPGYLSRPVAAGDRLDVGLTLLPDTRSIAWGSGIITLPSQTLADGSGNQISIRRGWLWGKGTGAFTIRTPDLDIAVDSGSFALEYFPGESSWLYVAEGNAQLTSSAADGTIRMSAGQMLAFGPNVRYPSPVALEDAVVRVLHAGEAVPVREEADTALSSRLRDAVEQQGIPFAQATIVAALGVVLLAAAGVLWRIRQRRELC